MNKRIKRQFWLSPEENDELKRKAQLAGISETAVIRILLQGFEPREKPDARFYDAMREMSDDEVVIAMVDANLQRDHILPSEKSFAYKMKVEALNHQGVASRQLGEKLWSITKVSKDSNESERQIQRYIRLTHLIPELLSKVDDGKMAFSPAVEISFLEPSEQRVLLNAMDMNDCTPSHAQAIKLKKYSQKGVLNDQTIYEIMAEEKPNQQEQYKFKRHDIRKYFPKSYTDKQVCDTAIKLLEQWQRKRERDRDSR